jgi:virginiamycin B lyase
MFVFRFLTIVSLTAIAVTPATVRKTRAAVAGVKTPGVQIPFAKLKSEASISLPGAASGLVAVTDTVYVAAGEAISAIDVKTNKAAEVLRELQKPCAGVANAFGTLIAADCGKHALIRVDAKAKSVKATVSLPVIAGLLTTDDSIWVLSDDKTTLTRIDPEVNRIIAEVRLPAGCTSLAFGEGALWATCPNEDRLLRIDPQTNLVKERIEIKGSPVAVATGEGSVWVLTKAQGNVVRVDPKTNKVTATIELNVPDAVGALAVGDGSVWVSVPGFPIARIDAASEKVMQQFTGEGGGILYSAAASIWVGAPGQNTLHRFDPKRIKATLAE